MPADTDCGSMRFGFNLMFLLLVRVAHLYGIFRDLCY